MRVLLIWVFAILWFVMWIVAQMWDFWTGMAFVLSALGLRLIDKLIEWKPTEVKQ